MSDLAMTKTEHWAFRFTVMLSLSVVVAVMGLALNSAAVVIGAMLLAPLMQPVLASGATLAMALFSRSVLSLGRVLLATVWCIAISYVLWKLLPEQPLTPEILARTNPDIKDLVVALAAGTAGAFASVREDASSSLPGVAVAVALVPPLATVGIALANGDTDRSLGALLLYTTNLAAIIFASILVFIATGFVPPRRLASNLSRLIIASVVLGIVVSIIAVPLYNASVSTREANDNRNWVEEAVDIWLEDGAKLPNDFEKTVAFVDDDESQVMTIKIGLRSFEQPPDRTGLINRIEQEFPNHNVLVEWIKIEQATTTTTSTIPPDEKRRLELQGQAAEIVRQWLQDSGLRFQLDEESGVLLDGSILNIDAAGNGDPPSIDELSNRLSEQFEIAVTPSLTWTEREVINLGDNEPTPLEQKQAQMQLVIDDWASRRRVQLQSFTFDGERIEIDVAGDTQPTFTQLEPTLREIAESDVPVRIYFTQRQLVTTTLPPEIPLSDP